MENRLHELVEEEFWKHMGCKLCERDTVPGCAEAGADSLLKLSSAGNNESAQCLHALSLWQLSIADIYKTYI
ncbi:hypothetical protein CSA37_00545 [Candidatus Fermentibacteria bacterium]|nr:MAG: hypothetical protein CSA37_09775 [Candidatus Fermentibacteria bacterium]PIE53688.1 MAG: hypothetical protein CSA37_00545 [Candidatus Fermentibacteria bacterium]